MTGVSATGPGQHAIKPCGHTLPRFVTDGGRDRDKGGGYLRSVKTEASVSRSNAAGDHAHDGREDFSMPAATPSSDSAAKRDGEPPTDGGQALDAKWPSADATARLGGAVTDGGQATTAPKREWYCKNCEHTSTDPWDDQTCPDCGHDAWTSHPQLITDGGRVRRPQDDTLEPDQKRCPDCGKVMHKNRWPQHVGGCTGGDAE